VGAIEGSEQQSLVLSLSKDEPALVVRQALC
jgi:hypothetical protein